MRLCRTDGTRKTLVNAIQRTLHKQLVDSHVDNPTQNAILLLSQTAKNTAAHLQQPNSDAHEADDSCFQVSLARRLLLAHPAASHPTNISPTCPNVSAAKRTCACPTDTHQLHSMTCRSGGGVDQRPALAKCFADLITPHTAAPRSTSNKLSPGLSRSTQPGAQAEGARIDVFFDLQSSTNHIDTAIVTPFSSNAGLISAASGRPGFMAKREEKETLGRYTRKKLAPFVFETTGRPGYHAKKFIKALYSDKDHPPTSIRDAWAAIQTALHNNISKPQLRAVTT